MWDHDNVLALLLDCGSDDLSILDDMDVDWEEVIEDCKANDNVSLSGLMEGAWDVAFSEFKEAVEAALPEIKERISAYAALDDDGSTDLPPEIADVPDIYGYGYMDVENFSEPAKEDLEELERIDLDGDFEFNFNFQCNGIYILRHSSLYSRLFSGLLDELEEKMGIGISNREHN